MPFQSEKQRRYLHANHPEIAKRWERDYAGGGRIGFDNGSNGITLGSDKYNIKFEPGASGSWRSQDLGHGYNVDEKTMRNILKNHKNWSLFQFKGEISKFGYADAAKAFFKKGTAVTRFGQDMVGWKIGTGIGDAITEHTGFDLWGHKGLMDIGSGIAGYKLAPKVGRKIQQFVTNLPKKATRFFNDGRT